MKIYKKQFKSSELPFNYQIILDFYKENMSLENVIAGGFARAVGHYLLRINEDKHYLNKKGDVDFFNFADSKNKSCNIKDNFIFARFLESFKRDFINEFSKVGNNYLYLNSINKEIDKLFFMKKHENSDFCQNYYYTISNFYSYSDGFIDNSYINDKTKEVFDFFSNKIAADSLNIKLQNVINDNFIFKGIENIFENFDFSNSCWCIVSEKRSNNYFDLYYTQDAIFNDTKEILSINKEEHNFFLPMRISKYLSNRNCKNGLDKKSKDILNTYLKKCINNNWLDYDSLNKSAYGNKDDISFTVVQKLNNLKLLDNLQLSLFIDRWKIYVKKDPEKYSSSVLTDFASHNIRKIL